MSGTRHAQMIGEYRLVQKLGRGNFGTVCLAEHLHQQAQVAIKVLQVSLANSEDLREFLKETRVIMQLQHPHIMPLLDAGLYRDDFPFLVMEYIPDGTLADRHPKGSRVPLATITEYVDQIASALQYAHDRHIVHRDIKPANILVRSDGTLLLSDFGINSVIVRSTLTGMQTYAGTPAYMAPEQHKGQSSSASDQYALAVAVYEWISGTPPFDGDSFGLAFQHTMVRPPSLRKFCPTLSPQIEQVLFKALAKEPEQRFATVQEFAAAFSAVVQELDLQAEKTKKLVFEKDEILALAPATPALTPVEPQIAQQSLSVEQTTDAKALQTKITSARINSFLRKNLFLFSVVVLISILTFALVTHKGGVSLQQASPGSLPVLTLPVTPTAASSTSHNAHPGMYQILNPDTVSHLAKLWTFQAAGSIYYSSPVTIDGVVYVGTSDGHVYAIDERSGQMKWAFQTGGAVVSSPCVVDGMVYVGSDDHKVYALDAQSGREKWAFATGGAMESSPAVANGVAYFGSSDGHIYAVDAQSGKLKWLFVTHGPVKSSAAVVNDVVYVGSLDKNVYALDARSGQLKWYFRTGSDIYSSPAVVDGFVYIGSMDNNVYALDAQSGQLKWYFRTGSNVYSSPTVVGGIVYIGSNDRSIYALDAKSGKQKWAFQTGGNVAGSPTVFNGVAYFGSGDGKFYALAAGSGQIKWAFQTGDKISSSPVVVDNTVYFASQDHRVYAFALQNIL